MYQTTKRILAAVAVASLAAAGTAAPAQAATKYGVKCMAAPGNTVVAKPPADATRVLIEWYNGDTYVDSLGFDSTGPISTTTPATATKVKVYAIVSGSTVLIAKSVRCH